MCNGISMVGSFTFAGAIERRITKRRKRSVYSPASVPNVIYQLHRGYTMSVRNIYWGSNIFAWLVLKFYYGNKYVSYRFDSLYIDTSMHTRPSCTIQIYFECSVPRANACPIYIIMYHFHDYVARNMYCCFNFSEDISTQTILKEQPLHCLQY